MPCRSVGSPIRFFDPILNNALALRASQKKNDIFEDVNIVWGPGAHAAMLQTRIKNQRYGRAQRLIRPKCGILGNIIHQVAKVFDRLF